MAEQKKMIKTKEGILELSLEQILVKYNIMLKKFAKGCVISFKYVPSAVMCEYQDYLQIGRIVTSTAFNYYDIERDICFSTMLNVYLNHMSKELAKYFLVKKRFNGYGFADFDIEQLIDSSYDEFSSIKEEKIECKGNLKERFVKYKNSNEGKKDTEYITEELSDYLKNNLTDDEILYYRITLCKKKNKVDRKIKDSVEFMLDSLCLGHEELDSLTKKIELAKVLNISRPTINRKMKKIEQKVINLTQDYLQKKYGRLNVI